MKIKSTEQINILHTKIDFKYSIDGSSKVNEYSYSNDELLVLKPNTDTFIQFNKQTQYDDDTQKIVDSDSGTFGFYLPTAATGHYDMQLVIQSEQSYCTYMFHNNLNFVEGNNVVITIQPTFIKDIDDTFTKVVF
jgi:hypothetical protein